jgi:hypothetical protein
MGTPDCGRARSPSRIQQWPARIVPAPAAPDLWRNVPSGCEATSPTPGWLDLPRVRCRQPPSQPIHPSRVPRECPPSCSVPRPTVDRALTRARTAAVVSPPACRPCADPRNRWLRTRRGPSAHPSIRRPPLVWRILALRCREGAIHPVSLNCNNLDGGVDQRALFPYA